MQVSAWSNGSGSYGFRIGVRNRDRYFSRDWDEIDLELGGEHYRVRITSGFWRACPEVRDSAIKDWLREHRTLEWPRGQPPKIEMVPMGGNRFRVE